jgi:hypothetical protein
MRRLQVLALAALALSKGESYFAAAVPPRPLHQDAGLALSGCEAVLDTLFTMLRNPPQEVRPAPFARHLQREWCSVLDRSDAAPLSFCTAP